MNIVFRVDASIQMGTGHVMRCLTLANTLKVQNNQSYFICRQHEGHLIQLIKDNGYKILVLPAAPSKTRFSSNTDELLHHAKWLGIDMLDDADQAIRALEAENIQHIDYIIVDHYALDKHWEDKLKPYTQNIMVIDDLADRQHSCNLLLDQTFGRSQEDYKNLVPNSCTILTGSQYALLRPEFAKWREYSIKRRIRPEFKKLLITMGGVDPYNYTETILQELNRCKLPEDLIVTVVLGTTAPYLSRVKELAISLPLSINVKVGVDNMAEIMANSDMAIGAAGATTWERCCLGLPTIQVIIAKNQELIAKTLSIRGVISCLVDFTELSVKLEEVKEKYSKMFFGSLSISDGKGSKRVAEQLFRDKENRGNINFYPVCKKDRDYIFSLQTSTARQYSVIPSIPSFSEHKLWFSGMIKNHKSLVFLIFKNSEKIGMIRLDNISTQEVNEISIIIDSQFTGMGIGEKVISQVLNVFRPEKLRATIHKENIASIKIFSKQGFMLEEGDEVFSEYNYLSHKFKD